MFVILTHFRILLGYKKENIQRKNSLKIKRNIQRVKLSTQMQRSQNKIKHLKG